MEIDIREVGTEVSVIRFADEERSDGGYQATILIEGDCGQVNIMEDGTEDYVRITNKQHAHDLIKALEKAIELGWLE